MNKRFKKKFRFKKTEIELLRELVYEYLLHDKKSA